MRSGLPALAVALLLVLAGCAGALGVGTEPPADAGTASSTTPATPAAPSPPSPTAAPSQAGGDATATPADTAPATPTPPSTSSPPPTPAAPAAPPDPASDRLGWEGGLWHNETIDVDPADGLDSAELAAVTNRSMARVERVRGLEFERTVPVEVIARSTYRERVERRSDRVSRNASLRRNVGYEATFLLGENGSAVDRAADTRASTALGYYSPRADRIVIVSENATAPRIDEITLSQELFHALQSREFDAARFAAPTRELHNARDGLVEGDGNYVDYLYERRCGAAWDCLRPDRGGGGGGGGDVHVGIAALRLQPYSDGPPFVRGLRREGGWDAVDAAYDDPPASTEQTIHPAAYGTDAPTRVELADASTDAWVVPDVPGPDYQSFGEAGLYVTLWYPSVVASREAGAARTVVIPYRDFFAPAADDLDRYDYRSNYTAGWDGDLLVPYVARERATGEGAGNASAGGNATGYVWKTVWDSERDAAEFADGYRRLLSYHGARRLDARSGPDATVETWRIADGPFADAFRVVVREDAVLIVNAPTVDALEEIRPRPPARGG